MPGVLITSRGGESKIFPWLPHEYRRFEDRAFKLQGIVVWIHDSCVAAEREMHRSDRMHRPTGLYRPDLGDPELRA